MKRESEAESEENSSERASDGWEQVSAKDLDGEALRDESGNAESERDRGDSQPSDGIPISEAEEPIDVSELSKVLQLPSQQGECTVYVVGTAHVSERSCDVVRKVIRHVKPEMVFLELCHSRTAVLRRREIQVASLREMMQMLRNGSNIFGVVYSVLLAKISQSLKTVPGAEFTVAFEEAQACGAMAYLGDRPITITLERTWSRLSTWKKVQLIFSLVTEGFPSAKDIEDMLKETDMLTLVVQEAGKQFPTLVETLLTERDLYMTAMLQHLAQSHSSIVAVVGLGHVSGIIANHDKHIEVEPLLQTPPKRRSYFLLVASTCALGVAGIYVLRRIR